MPIEQPHKDQNNVHEIWSQLSESEIAQHQNQPDEFFRNLSAKYNISREDAERHLNTTNSEHTEESMENAS